MYRPMFFNEWQVVDLTMKLRGFTLGRKPSPLATAVTYVLLLHAQ